MTGGIGSGKSTVATMLAECGAGIISADQVVRRLLWRSSPCFPQILKIFGPEILTYGRIDRRKLAQCVFSSNTSRRQLEEILHPVAHSIIWQRCHRWQRQHRYRVAVVDVPLLFEVGWDKDVDIKVVVKADLEQQVNRATRHLKISSYEVKQRVSAQMPLAEKIKRADVVIDNRGNIKNTRTQVRTLWQDLKKMAKQSIQRKMK